MHVAVSAVTLLAVLPWDTLRRLLGLPSDMDPPSALSLVEMAVGEPRRSRLIALVLEGMPPREPPAGAVLGALDRGALASDMAAELLGAIGHGSAYRTLITMLYDDVDAAAAAGVAMAKVLGPRARTDLLAALRGAPTREGREGAALGLTELGDAHAATALTESGCDGLIRARVAARCAVRLTSAPELWLAYLIDERVERRRLGTEVVYVLLLADVPEARAQLVALGDAGRDAVRTALEDPELFMLPDKREALAAWVT